MLTDQDVQGPRIKIERARKHIQELEAQILAYRARKPYQVVGQVETRSGDTVFRFKIIEPVPNEFAAIVGDAVHNLRSALDLLACACARANGQSDTKTYFPITADLASFKIEGRKKIKLTSANVQSFISGLKPYGGGNDDLWRLHQLDILDKHRFIKLVFPYPHSFGMGLGIPGVVPADAMPKAMFGFKKPEPLSDSSELLRQKGGAPEGAFDKSPEFSVELSLGEQQILGRYEPVLTTLHRFVGLVDGIVEGIRKNA